MAPTTSIAEPSPVTTTTKRRKKRKRQNKKPVPLVAKHHSVAAAATTTTTTAGNNTEKKHNKSLKKKAATSDTTNTTPPPLFSSTAESLQLIAAYHTLNKRLEFNARDESLTASERATNAARIKKEQEELGGIEMYQQASMYGAKANGKFVCAKWVAPILKQQQQRQQQHQTSRRPRILDVGAIDNQYLPYKDWIDAVAIDLNAQHPSVVKADFFAYAHEHLLNRRHEKFDAVVLSLVLNFQGDPRKRGDMLALSVELLHDDSKGGMVFVVLPSASLDNSRYCDEGQFVEIAATLGLELQSKKRSAKLALLAFQKKNNEQQHSYYNPETELFNYGKKEMGRPPAKPGVKRNNFTVMLKNSTMSWRT